MDFSQYALAAFVIIGLVNGIQLAFEKDWKGFALFCTAVSGATLFGLLQWFGLPDVQTGLAVGISSSGVYKVAKKIGGLE